jgi:hypothetical protein
MVAWRADTGRVRRMTLEEEIAGLKASMANANETIKHLENRIIDLERAMKARPPKKVIGWCLCRWRGLAQHGVKVTGGRCDDCGAMVRGAVT